MIRSKTWGRPDRGARVWQSLVDWIFSAVVAALGRMLPELRYGGWLAFFAALVMLTPPVALSAPLYDILNIGLTGSEHTRNDGYQFVIANQLNEAGQVRGYSQRYNGGAVNLGLSAWLYDGTTTLNIGLTGSEYTRSDGFQYSVYQQLNEAGQVSGASARYNGGMNHAYSAKHGRQYRYYVCYRAQQYGWQACPAPSIPAGEIERFVVSEIKSVGRDPLVIKETLAQARWQAEEQIEGLKAERAGLHARLRGDHADLGRLAVVSSPGDPGLVDAHDRISDAERRVTEIDDELAALNGNLVDEAEVAAALGDFGALWDCLAPREQARVIELLVEQITYDGKDGNISITFRPTGIKTLAGELGNRQEEAA